MPAKLLFAMGMTMFLIFGFLFAILAVVGYYLNFSVNLMLIFAFILILFQWAIGPKIIWWTTNMQEISRKDYPWIFDVVEKICKKTKTPIPKRIAVVNSGAPNAFVFGRTPSSANLAITRGLLQSLNKDEVTAVIAHEMGHINHKDVVVMTIVGAIPILMYYLAQSMMWGRGTREGKNAGTAALIGLGAFLVYFITNLLVLYLSRLREYYADNFSGKNYRPKALASALAKITYGLSVSPDKEKSGAKYFSIADPSSAVHEMSRFKNEYADLELNEKELKGAMEWEKRNPFARLSEILSSHPLSFKRINELMKMEKNMK